MKIGKKTVMGISVIVGTVMFATTAFAEVSAKSGYDQLKDALKYTSSNCSSKFSSFTMSGSIVIKDNGAVVSEVKGIRKFDGSQYAIETVESSNVGNKTYEDYNYCDKNESIIKDTSKNIYYVSNYPKGRDTSKPLFENIFGSTEEGDYERIADALIGNLKDSVIVTENSDGTKELKGTISEAQIPAIANALASFETKNMSNEGRFSSGRSEESIIPKLEKDIYVKEIKGDMVLSKDGLIQSVIGDVVITGTDKSGKSHEITCEILGKISDINNTSVKKPDLTGKKVQTEDVLNDGNKLSNPQMYVGTYKSDIVIVKDGKFQKVGEQILEIKSLDNKTLVGSYNEQYLAGNEALAAKAQKFDFTAKINSQNPFSYGFTFKDNSGNKANGSVYMNPNSSSVSMGVDTTDSNSLIGNGELKRVFN